MFEVKHLRDGGTRLSCPIKRQILILALVTFMCGVATSMRVKHFYVPTLVDLKSPDPLRLECDVEINAEERSLVVIEWHRNDTLLYLWSEHRKTKYPYINSNFVDPITINSTKLLNNLVIAPLIITNKSTNMNGWYKCLANINAVSEVLEETEMKTYVPVDNITLNQDHVNGTEVLNVICGTENVYPRPEIKLLINGQEEDFTNTTDQILDVRLNENQLFDINATFKLSIESLKPSSKINCSIILPEVGYSSSRLTQFDKSGYTDDEELDTDVDKTSTLSAQNSSAPGSSSKLNQINSYLISTSVLAIFTMARGFI